MSSSKGSSDEAGRIEQAIKSINANIDNFKQWVEQEKQLDQKIGESPFIQEISRGMLADTKGRFETLYDAARKRDADTREREENLQKKEKDLQQRELDIVRREAMLKAREDMVTLSEDKLREDERIFYERVGAQDVIKRMGSLLNDLTISAPGRSGQLSPEQLQPVSGSVHSSRRSMDDFTSPSGGPPRTSPQTPEALSTTPNSPSLSRQDSCLPGRGATTRALAPAPSLGRKRSRHELGEEVEGSGRTSPHTPGVTDPSRADPRSSSPTTTRQSASRSRANTRGRTGRQLSAGQSSRPQLSLAALSGVKHKLLARMQLPSDWTKQDDRAIEQRLVELDSRPLKSDEMSAAQVLEWCSKKPTATCWYQKTHRRKAVVKKDQDGVCDNCREHPGGLCIDVNWIEGQADVVFDPESNEARWIVTKRHLGTEEATPSGDAE